ncbi:MAG: 50S ribosomal protein L18 [Candidatus Aminicenantes bacterium]|nr:50S ribosomal protein L18 [Candidatus Aminicenantes bacterium]
MHKDNVTLKKKAKDRIRKRIRKKISGTPERPRTFVYKSNRHLYVQVIDDVSGKVITAASTLEKDYREKNKNTKNMEASKKLGELVASKLKKEKIKTVVFDRGTHPYHGRVKTLAEAMRKGGITF